MTEQLTPTSDEIAVHDLIHRINEAWLHRRGDALATALNPCFAEDAIMRGPGFLLLGASRAFAVRSYQDFVAQAAVKRFVCRSLEVDVRGATAVAQYTWEMTYVIAGQEHTEHGHDVFVCSRQIGLLNQARGWLVVWRVMLPEQA